MQHIMDTIFEAAIVCGVVFIVAKCSDIAARVIRSYLRGKRIKQIKEERR